MSCKEKSQNACFASVFKNVLDNNRLATFSLPSPQISYDIFDCRKPKKPAKQGHLLFSLWEDQVEFGVSKDSHPTHPSVPACTEGWLLSPICHHMYKVAVTAPGMRCSHNQMRNGEGLGQGVIPMCLFPFIMEGTFQKNLERWWRSQHANPEYNILACWIFHVRGTFCYTWRKRTSLSQKAKQRGTKKDLNEETC